MAFTISFLQKGQIFMKYGKWGKPHEKLVYLSSDTKYIEWKDPATNKDQIGSLELTSVQRIEDYEKSVYFCKKKVEEDQKKFCFSIVGAKRNLDLQAREMYIKNTFIDALRTLMNNKKE